MKPLPRDVTLILLVGLLAAVLIVALLLRARGPASALSFEQCDALVAQLHRRVKQIEEPSDADLARALDVLRMQVAYLGLRLHQFGERAYFPEDPAWRRIEQVQRDVEAVQEGVYPFKHRRGPLIRGYRSSLDGSLQPYALAVPPGYDRSAPMPLIVSLHGFSWPRRVEEPPLGFNPNAIILVPHGRDSTDFMHTGEVDVLDAIAHMATDYAIDADRIYLVGRSMGGTGCWWLASRYPDRFAAIAPAQGNTNHHLWHPDRQAHADNASIEQLTRFLRSAFDPSAYAENCCTCRRSTCTAPPTG